MGHRLFRPMFCPARRHWLRAWLSVCGGLALTRALSAQRPAPADDDTLRLTTELVLVNVTVMDEQGGYVRGLRPEDFIVFQDGAAQQIEHFSTGDAPFCAAVMIDASDSMRVKLRNAQAAAAHFQSLIRANDAVAVYAFSSAVEQIQDFSSSRTVVPRLWALRARGKTRLYDGLRVVIEALDARPEQRRAIVLISDGVDTASDAQPHAIARQAAQADVIVYAIDLHDARFPTRHPAEARHAAWLSDLATTTGGRYIKSPGGAHLAARFAEVIEELRAQYTIGFYPPNGYDGRTHTIRVVVRRPNVTWRARKNCA
ncbi:MAG: VWA domain-containing protein [Chloracidobacterium sp.]|nr:VWA domain-containing protein [Chloracidobacterium sp.]MDW8216907.1 VWA domain-containing protein [Acidobacteriota bacterium]